MPRLDARRRLRRDGQLEGRCAPLSDASGARVLEGAPLRALSGQPRRAVRLLLRRRGRPLHGGLRHGGPHEGAADGPLVAGHPAGRLLPPRRLPLPLVALRLHGEGRRPELRHRHARLRGRGRRAGLLVRRGRPLQGLGAPPEVEPREVPRPSRPARLDARGPRRDALQPRVVRPPRRPQGVAHGLLGQELPRRAAHRHPRRLGTPRRLDHDRILPLLPDGREVQGDDGVDQGRRRPSLAVAGRPPLERDRGRLEGRDPPRLLQGLLGARRAARRVRSGRLGAPRQARLARRRHVRLALPGRPVDGGLVEQGHRARARRARVRPRAGRPGRGRARAELLEHAPRPSAGSGAMGDAGDAPPVRDDDRRDAEGEPVGALLV